MPNKTLAEMVAKGESLYISCTHPACYRKTVQLDVQALADRLGPDHGAMHDDLVSLFRCKQCDDEGRDRRPVQFTCIPNYERDRLQRNARPMSRAH